MTHWDKLTAEEIEAARVSEEKKAEDLAKAENPATIDAETHKLATTELSKKGEALIKANIKLAEVSPKSILEIEDVKLQNKIIKHIYWYENLDELQSINGNKFYESKTEEEHEMDELEIMKKEVQLLKLQNRKWATSIALDNYKRENDKLFTDNPDALEKIKSEMENISDKLSPAERVERAAKYVYGNYVDSTTKAYLDMQEKGGAKAKTIIKESWEIDRDNEFSAIFDRRFKKETK